MQTGQAVEDAEAIIVIISPHSVGSRQVTKEIVRAHEAGKDFIPVRRGISHIEFQNRQPEWREAIGAAASIEITADSVEDVALRIADGVKALGINPKPRADSAHIEQIRKTLAKLQGQSPTGEAARPEVSVRQPAEEPVARDVPAIETPGKRKKYIRISAIAAAAVVIIVVVVVLLSGLFGKYSMDVLVSPEGGGTVSPAGGDFDADSMVNLTATPAKGYAFDRWSVTSPTHRLRSLLTWTAKKRYRLLQATIHPRHFGKP